MKFQMKYLVVLLALTLGTGPTWATVYTYNFTGINAAIPDATWTGYANRQTISGLSNVITEVRVRLKISGGYNGDLYALLVSPAGTSTVLVNRVGIGTGSGLQNMFGFADPGFDITLRDDGAGTSIHNANGGGSTVVGTYHSESNNLHSVFDGQTPNGTWSLFLADIAGGDTSTLVSWRLDVITAGAVAGLQWTTPPDGAVSGSPFATQPVLQTVDQSGYPTTSGLPSSLIVTVTKTLGSGTLFGTTNYDIGSSAGNGTGTCSGLGVRGGSGAVELTASVGAGYGAPVTNMAVWLDATDRDTISIGDDSSVVEWDDKSGNAKHFLTTIGSSGSITYSATVN